VHFGKLQFTITTTTGAQNIRNPKIYFTGKIFPKIPVLKVVICNSTGYQYPLYCEWIVVGISNNTSNQIPLYYNDNKFSAKTTHSFWWAFAITPVIKYRITTTTSSVGTPTLLYGVWVGIGSNNNFSLLKYNNLLPYPHRHISCNVNCTKTRVIFWEIRSWTTVILVLGLVVCVGCS
jgi:hypothetical protein